MPTYDTTPLSKIIHTLPQATTPIHYLQGVYKNKLLISYGTQQSEAKARHASKAASVECAYYVRIIRKTRTRIYNVCPFAWSNFVLYIEFVVHACKLARPNIRR